MDSLLLPSLGEPALRFIPEAGPPRNCKAAIVCSELEELSCWTLPASSHSSFDRVFVGHPSENASPDSYDNCVKQESAPCVASPLALEATSMAIFDRSKSMVPLFSPAVSVVLSKPHKLAANTATLLLTHWRWIRDETCHKDNVIPSLRKLGPASYSNWGLCRASTCHTFTVVAEYKSIKCCDHMISVCTISDSRTDYKSLDAAPMASWRTKYHHFHAA